MNTTHKSAFTIAFEQILDHHDGDIEWEWAHPAFCNDSESDTNSESDTDSDDDMMIQPPFFPRTPSLAQRTIRTVHKSGHTLHIRAPHTLPRAAPALAAPGLSAAHIISSTFVAAVHTLSALEPHTALLVLDIAACPAPGCRFVNASITLAFLQGEESSSPSTDDENNTTMRAQAPKVLGLAPQHSVGAWTPAQTLCIRTAASSPTSSPPSPSLGTTTIEGSIRAGASKCVWTVEENASSRHGIPARLRLVAAIACPDPRVGVRVDVRGEVGCGDVSAPVAAKHGGVARVLPVRAGRDCGNASEAGVAWRRYLKDVTGRVDTEEV